MKEGNIVKIWAHRGASKYAPENTLAAFQKAIELGADGIELDVRLSKDNVPVVCHDPTINRTSNGKGYIHQLTLNGLKKHHFYGKFKWKFRKEKIPTLEEVLQLVQDHSIKLNIELKNGPNMPPQFEEKILSLVDKYNMEERVLYSSFDHQCIARLQTLHPEANIALIFHINLVRLFDYLDQTNLHIYSIHPNYFYVTEEIVAQAKKRNLKLFIYTVNDPRDALHYAKIGVDGLITDDPLVLKT